MFSRLTVSAFAALFGVGVAIAQDKPQEKTEIKKVPIRETSPASGKEMYTQ